LTDGFGRFSTYQWLYGWNLIRDEFTVGYSPRKPILEMCQLKSFGTYDILTKNTMVALGLVEDSVTIEDLIGE